MLQVVKADQSAFKKNPKNKLKLLIAWQIINMFLSLLLISLSLRRKLLNLIIFDFSSLLLACPIIWCRQLGLWIFNKFSVYWISPLITTCWVVRYVFNVIYITGRKWWRRRVHTPCIFSNSFRHLNFFTILDSRPPICIAVTKQYTSLTFFTKNTSAEMRAVSFLILEKEPKYSWRITSKLC